MLCSLNLYMYRVAGKSDYTFLVAYISGTTGRTVKIFVPITRKSYFRYSRVGLQPYQSHTGSPSISEWWVFKIRRAAKGDFVQKKQQAIFPRHFIAFEEICFTVLSAIVKREMCVKDLIRGQIWFPFVWRVFQLDQSPNKSMATFFRQQYGRADNLPRAKILPNQTRPPSCRKRFPSDWHQYFLRVRCGSWDISRQKSVVGLCFHPVCSMNLTESGISSL